MKFMHQFGTQLTLFATGDLSIGATRNPFHLHTCEVAIRAVWLGTNRIEPSFSPYFSVSGTNRHYPWLLTSRLRFPNLRFANRHEPARQTEQTRVEPRTAQARVEP